MSSGNSNRHSRICELCKRQFFVKRPSETGRFCSQTCHYLSRREPLTDRFFGMVGQKTANGCILWGGQRDKHGYGTIFSGPRPRKHLLAHRVSYEIFRGPIPAGLGVLHECDNPPCINPYHLFLGTQADNMADKMHKGRQCPGEQHYLHKLTEADVRAIRNRYLQGDESYAQLGKEFGVHEGTIKQIIRGKSWKHVN